MYVNIVLLRHRTTVFFVSDRPLWGPQFASEKVETALVRVLGAPSFPLCWLASSL